MGNLLRLLFKNGGFVVFVLTQVVCFFIIVAFNDKQGAVWGHTAGKIGGSILERRQKTMDYIGLNARVDSLVRENALLQEQLSNAKSVQVPYRDTFFVVRFDSLIAQDSIRRKTVRPLYEFIAARVISNNISGSSNWLMLNRGANDKLAKNTGIVTPKGIVGILRYIDSDFSMAMSILHSQTKISACLPKYGNAFGSLIWEGGDPEIMLLKYIPKHFPVKPGDMVETSGLSQIFPKGIPIGKVEEEPVIDSENPYFFNIKIRLSQSMATVQDVHVVNNLFTDKIEALEQRVKNEQ